MIKGHLAADNMLAKSVKDHTIFFVAYAQWIVSNSGIKEAMDSKIISAKLKYKVDEISSSSASSFNIINELKISVASVKKAANNTISTLGSL